MHHTTHNFNHSLVSSKHIAGFFPQCQFCSLMVLENGTPCSFIQQVAGSDLPETRRGSQDNALLS